MFSPLSGNSEKPKPSELIDRLTEMLDVALVTRTKAEYAEGRGSGVGAVAKHRIGAGYIGLECGRQLAYKYHKTAKEERGDSKVSPGELQRHAEFGHVTESFGGQWLRDAGFEIHTEKPDGSQYGYIACPDASGQARIAGEIDGVIVAGPDILPYPCLWESKKATDKKFKVFAKSGVKKADPKYYGQLQTNMLYLEVENTLFLMLNLDTMKFYFEIVTFDPKEAQRLQDRAAMVLDTKEPEDMPRITSVREDFRCKFCEYSTRCWEERPASVSGTPAPVWLNSPSIPKTPSFDLFKTKNPF